MSQRTEPVLLPDHPHDPDCTEFTVRPDVPSIWLTIGNLSLQVVQRETEAAVLFFPKGEEHEPIEEVSVSFAVAESLVVACRQEG